MAGETFADAVVLQHEALVAFMRGDTRPYEDLCSRGPDVTLANPFGGVAQGWDEVLLRVQRAASYYEDGEVVGIETITSYHSGDLGYAIEIERLRARVAGRDVFDEVGLRTTTVFRREASGWRLLHRHADPAVDLRAPQAIL